MDNLAMDNMKMQRQKSGRGFTLLELMISMALGLIVMAAMASLFKTGMNSTMLVTQRAETQQNMRAAIDLMVKDISMAGAGLPSGGLQLPTGGGATAAKFGCDQSGTCHVTNHTYAGNFMYGIIPGYTNGVEGGATITAAPPPAINDSITVAYADYNFPLFEYDVTFPSAPDGTSICLTPNTAFSATPPPAVNGAGGIKAGDLILINGANGVTAVGEATNVTANSITFAQTDPLNMNWTGGTHTNNIYAVSSNVGYATCPPPVTVPQTTQGTAYRLYVVTYYLTVPGAGQTPRLMRQVNGLTPAPVADDIVNLQFAFDTYNSTTSALDANQANPIGVGESPSNIQKVNLIVMGQSIINNGNKSQNMFLTTSVSARNMAFRDRYQ
ncbi:MAG TPA: prepilin-type N-terminal cleavage/methylation domain-containing protein [Candidatus Solibacter sp.]|nr:prepilin-type N-terminal cleavage/methylation domain-containing protein [Candidatus Solibacter sp.]